MDIRYLLLPATLMLMCISCSTDEDQGNGLSIPLNQNVASTIPSIASTSVKSRAVVDSNNIWGGAYYKTNLSMIYKTFQSYNNATDNGKIDASNIYKVLFETENSINNLINSPDTIAFTTPTAITPTYSFDAPSYLYTHHSTSQSSEGGNAYSNSAAFAIVGTNYKAVIGQSMSNPDVDNRSATLFEYDESTGDITLYCAMANDYLASFMGGTNYYVRSFIQGNMKSHTFFVQMQIAGGTNIVAKGVSQGVAGQYYVVYIANNYIPTSSGFYRIDASATETEYRHYDTTLLPVATYNLLANDTLGYGADIQTYIDGGSMFGSEILVGDFSNDGLLVLP